MAWKAPGEGGKDKGDDPRPQDGGGNAGAPQGRPEHDPWRGGRQRPSQQPPDLDEVAKRVWRTLTGKRRSGGPRDPNVPPSRKCSAFVLPGAILGVAALVWLGAGVYTVSDGQVGVVMRQGHYQNTVASGIHWNPSLIDRVTRVNVGQDHWLVTRRQQLTQDGNLVTLHVRASYRIVSAVDYVRNVEHPEQMLQSALDTAVSHVVSSHPLDELLSGERTVTSSAISSALQTAFPGQLTGTELRDVRIEEVAVPKSVEAAMKAAEQARQQAKTTIQDAEAQRDQLIAQAEREAHQLQEESRAYHDTAIARARSDIAQYMAVLHTYERAPEVTRDRLYLEAVRAIMAGPGIRIVNTQSDNTAVSVPPAGAPAPMGPPPLLPPHLSETSASGHASLLGTPAAKAQTAPRDAARSDRDSGERHYDRSLKEGRQ
ncbi:MULTISPECIES: FtsH protease activity modulator HflK [unclassified Zymobacter]|uniref:FtsH protease activity modulator HflK n=1 Tax=unclassified Zymobacter TaxID=3048685 RepID=UPI0039C4245B